MYRSAIIILMLTLIGCSSGQSQRRINRATFVAGIAGLACDYGQTRHAASQGWVEYSEANPIMGPTPSTGEVTAYFLGAALINTAVYLLTPERYRAIPQVGLTGVQAVAIRRNVESTGTLCGF